MQFNLAESHSVNNSAIILFYPSLLKSFVFKLPFSAFLSVAFFFWFSLEISKKLCQNSAMWGRQDIVEF